ncbi:hypothetical protein [Zavarzinia compransoris]|uniref:Uncharacterized protein n=1 Tax=Zavarzinia compransoris TaxID=1264899 RepID=A0A317E196_9PROT|nr:hypothetical protein [Zavarzinia compransoris]PWR19133.1 hypothetical protein DKG75_19455 [Zavarzinia compransoris]TDP49146.1 hypothetical protein DES42_101513 [Zavarzinia compransoris]
MTRNLVVSALGAALGLAVALIPAVSPAQTAAEDDRPPLLSAPPPPAPAPTGAAAAARRTPLPPGTAQPGSNDDFLSQALSDYPPEVVPPSATRRPVTVEGSSAVK